MPRFAQRLEQLEKRKKSHHYAGTREFDEAIEAFYWRTRARSGCSECLQSGEADDNSQCITDCPTWDAAETAEAELLDQSEMLSRILYERIMIKK
jgi:hypothetical protein